MLDPTMGAVTGMNGQGQCFNSANWADWPLSPTLSRRAIRTGRIPTA